MLVYYFVPFIVSNRYLLFWVLNGRNSVTVQNRTCVYMNFFDHKDLGNHPLQLCHKVVKHPVYLPICYTKDDPLILVLRQRCHCHMAEMSAPLQCRKLDKCPMLGNSREIIGVPPAVHVLQFLQILPPALLLVYPAHSLRLPSRQLLFGQRLLGLGAHRTPVVNRHFRLHVAMRRFCDVPDGPLVRTCERACVRGLPSLDSWHFLVSPTYIKGHATSVPHTSGTPLLSLRRTLLIRAWGRHTAVY